MTCRPSPNRTRRRARRPPSGSRGLFTTRGPGEHDSPDEGDDDVDDDDLDPQVPHSPPDGKKGRIVFDENEVAAG